MSTISPSQNVTTWKYKGKEKEQLIRAFLIPKTIKLFKLLTDTKIEGPNQTQLNFLPPECGFKNEKTFSNPGK